MNNARTQRSRSSANRKNPFRTLATAAFLSAALALAPLPALAFNAEPASSSGETALEATQNPVIAEAAEPDASTQQPEVQAEMAHIQSNLSAADAAEALADAALDASAAFAADGLALSEGQSTEPSSENASASDAETCSLTVYYCEMVFYEDPDFSHPTGMRLLKTKTVDGLTPGDTINPWDYVEVIDGYYFYDGWAENKKLSADSSQNNVQLNYFATTNNSFTMNYYVLTDGNAPISSHNIVPDNSGTKIGLNDQLASGDSIIADYYGEPVRITKLGSLQENDQLFGQTIEGSTYATPIEHMMFLDSYPSSIRVSTDPESNVINLFYAPTLTTLPDETPVPEGSEDSGDDGDQAPSPDVPVTPDAPGEGTTPDSPDTGTTPDNPDNPDNGTTPDNPSDSDNPSQGGGNTDGDQGGSGDDSNEPSTPGATEPTDPSDPSNPSSPDEGTTGEQPGNPSDSEGSTENPSAGTDTSNGPDATDDNASNGSSNDSSSTAGNENAADKNAATNDSNTLTQTGDSYAPIALAVALLAAISLGVVVVARRHLS